jgi:hypothetical protein
VTCFAFYGPAGILQSTALATSRCASDSDSCQLFVYDVVALHTLFLFRLRATVLVGLSVIAGPIAVLGGTSNEEASCRADRQPKYIAWCGIGDASHQLFTEGAAAPEAARVLRFAGTGNRCIYRTAGCVAEAVRWCFGTSRTIGCAAGRSRQVVNGGWWREADSQGEPPNVP